MSNTTKNHYVQKARQKALAGTHTASSSVETKHDIKKTLAYTGRDILFGAIGGSLAGAVMGRSSLLVGIAVTGAGHFLGSASAAMFGVGMMASGGYQAVSSGMNGVEKDGVEGIKERFGNFKDNLKRQLFLDKIISKKGKGGDDDGTNGMGNVQYFKHDEDLQGKELDFSEANRLEQQIEQSGKQFAQMRGISDDFSGTEHDDVNGLEGDMQERLM